MRIDRDRDRLLGRILADDVIHLPGSGKRLNEARVLRRVAVWDEVPERELVLLTNHFKRAATTIAAIDKDRWQIELFFKALKQNLKIKTFVGTSANGSSARRPPLFPSASSAVHFQIWSAWIAILPLTTYNCAAAWL